jgi:hypothetical protein
MNMNYKAAALEGLKKKERNSLILSYRINLKKEAEKKNRREQQKKFEHNDLWLSVCGEDILEYSHNEKYREERARRLVVSVKISAPNPKNWSKNSKGLGRKKKRGSGSRGDKQARRCVLGNFEVPASVLNAFESSVIQKPLAFNKESKAKKRLGMRKEKFRNFLKKVTSKT